MTSFIRTIALIAAVYLPTGIVGAATISPAELPANVISCVTSLTCLVTLDSFYDSGTAAAFPVTQTSGGNAQNDWLIRYTLAPPSQQSGTNPDRTESFGGYLWMLVGGTYIAADLTHPVSVFLDKVSPTPAILSGSDLELSFTVTTADLVAGYSDMSAALTSSGYQGSGSLAGEVPVMCLAITCAASANLNLLQLVFADTGAGTLQTGFNSGDQRGLVFAQQHSFLTGNAATDYSLAQSFHVNTVPLPGAGWMLGAGMLALLSRARRRSI